MNPVADLIGHHAVVAAGESTHGTAEFFALKQQLFVALVQTQGFRTLAMELTPEAAASIDEHLQTGAGDLSARVLGSYFFMEAEEIVALLAWMRAYNESHSEPVHLRGFDLDAQQRQLVDERCAERRGCRVVMRDHFMAQNVLKIGGGTMVWAHNGHVAHFEADDGWIPMGQHLRAALGSDYYAIAFEFSEGTFVAPAGGELPASDVRAIPHLGGFEVAEYRLGPAPAQALAAHFARVSEPRFFVELGEMAEPVRSAWATNRRLHSYGAFAPGLARHYEAYAPLPEAFDALIFVREASAYQPIAAAR